MTKQPTVEQIRFHYELERALAQRIMNSPKEARARVTLEAYNELFSRIPWHPGHLATPERRIAVEESYRVFIRLAGTGRDILEIGCGGSDHLRQLAAANLRCVGIDISKEVLEAKTDLPANIELYVADATDLSIFANESFDYVFSKQLIEHIHPDDVLLHYCEVQRVLRPGGRYVFETPNKLTGPHDVSRYFDNEATCFHLREYSLHMLLPLLRQAGFRRILSPSFRDRAYRKCPLLGRLTEVPAAWRLPAETFVAMLARGAVRNRACAVLRLNPLLIAYR